MLYIPAWRVGESLRNTIDKDEGSSFSLIPAWVDHIEKSNLTEMTYAYIQQYSRRFEAVFVCFGPIIATLYTLRPFYTLDSTNTLYRYNIILLIAISIDTEDRILPLA